MRNIFHNSQIEDYRSPIGAVTSGTMVHIQLEAEGAKAAKIRLWEDEKGESLIPMTVHPDWFEADIQTPSYPCVLFYFFVIDYENETVCLGNNRKEYGGPGEIYVNEEPESFQITVYEAYEAPEWYKNAIAYQIFPDRFSKAGGPDAASLEDAFRTDRKTESWNTDPYYIKNEEGNVTCWNFWGGNLNGITEKLDYLKELGIGVIYLNPVFEAGSNHRYDTSDYERIDPLLGDEKDFRTLCREARKRGIRIILDGVFSHTGINSRYYKEHPDWYTGRFWWGVRDLPEVDELNPEYMEYICGEDGILRKWMRLGCMGYRLDVADELPDAFIEKIRETVKDENPDAVLIGEVWEDASNKISYGKRRHFLGGRQLDCAMNYPLRTDIIDFLTGSIDAREFEQRQHSREENYPREALYSSFNLIGSHDRERIITVFGGDKEKAQLAAVLSFALPGVPVIYYGDEAGLTGGSDPENRKTYPWGSEDKTMMDFYKGITAFYNAHECLKKGDCRILGFGPDDLVINRSFGTDRVEIYINRAKNLCEIKVLKQLPV